MATTEQAATNNAAKGNTRKGVTEADRRVYTSKEEAQDNRPEGKENWACFQVGDPAGRLRWTWAPYYERALWQVAVEQDHYSIISMEEVPTKEEVSGMLAALPPEDRAALLAQYGGKKGGK
jgi:hypothetical protein